MLMAALIELLENRPETQDGHPSSSGGGRATVSGAARLRSFTILVRAAFKAWPPER